MNKAKEFFKENRHSITNIFEFAESYHQSRVKAISDEEIKIKAKSISYQIGVNDENCEWANDKILTLFQWFKNKLLKQ